MNTATLEINQNSATKDVFSLAGDFLRTVKVIADFGMLLEKDAAAIRRIHENTDVKKLSIQEKIDLMEALYRIRFSLFDLKKDFSDAFEKEIKSYVSVLDAFIGDISEDLYANTKPEKAEDVRVLNGSFLELIECGK